MTDNRMTELREKLDELGIEHFDYDKGGRTQTMWEAPDGKRYFTYETSNNSAKTARLVIAWHPTPEQAIAATLGSGECVPYGEWESISQTQEVRHVFCECGYELGMDRRDSFPFERTQLFAMPNFCLECGRKIRKAVGR